MPLGPIGSKRAGFRPELTWLYVDGALMLATVWGPAGHPQGGNRSNVVGGGSCSRPGRPVAELPIGSVGRAAAGLVADVGVVGECWPAMAGGAEVRLQRSVDVRADVEGDVDARRPQP